MTEETKLSRNSDAHKEFENWRDAARESLNQAAVVFVEEQKQMITAIIADSDVDFRIKLQLLEKHTGGELYLDQAAGFSPEQFQKWKQGEDLPSFAQQTLILGLLVLTICEWLEERYPLEQMIGVIGLLSIQGREVSNQTRSYSIQIPVSQFEQNKLGFDPWVLVTLAPYSEESLFSVRTSNALHNEGIRYLGQLVQETYHGVMRIPNFGRRARMEVEEILSARFGARLGMSEESYPELRQFNIDLKTRGLVDQNH